MACEIYIFICTEPESFITSDTFTMYASVSLDLEINESKTKIVVSGKIGQIIVIRR